MTKIQKQRLEFYESIDLSTWIGDSKEYFYLVSHWFSRYHCVVFDYFSTKNYEEFTKKWWIRIMGDKSKHHIPLKEEKVNTQKSNFSINYEKAALTIVERTKDRLAMELDALERKTRY